MILLDKGPDNCFTLGFTQATYSNMTTQYQKAYFLLSVAALEQLPPDEGVEVAIVGRSNAGKSSVINCITRKGMARVSKTPGRTQMINLFVIDEQRRLADLPGYGFARAPAAAKAKWERLLEAYFATRESLQGLILVMDIRHPLKELDWVLLDYCEQRNLPVHILLNKVDKLSRGAAAATLQAVRVALTDKYESVTLQSFSAMKGAGVKELHQVLDAWYELA